MLPWAAALAPASVPVRARERGLGDAAGEHYCHGAAPGRSNTVFDETSFH